MSPLFCDILQKIHHPSTRLHSSSMCTDRRLAEYRGGGGICLDADPPQKADTPQRADPPPPPPPHRRQTLTLVMRPVIHVENEEAYFPVDRMTDRCKNMTFPASLRYAVGKKHSYGVTAIIEGIVRFRVR